MFIRPVAVFRLRVDVCQTDKEAQTRPLPAAVGHFEYRKGCFACTHYDFFPPVL